MENNLKATVASITLLAIMVSVSPISSLTVSAEEYVSPINRTRVTKRTHQVREIIRDSIKKTRVFSRSEMRTMPASAVREAMEPNIVFVGSSSSVSEAVKFLGTGSAKAFCQILRFVCILS